MPREQQKREKDRYEKLIAKAEQAVRKGQWQEAANSVAEVSRGFPDLDDNRPRKILDDARFGLAMDRAKKAFGDGDLAAAMTAVDGALENSARR